MEYTPEGFVQSAHAIVIFPWRKFRRLHLTPWYSPQILFPGKPSEVLQCFGRGISTARVINTQNFRLDIICTDNVLICEHLELLEKPDDPLVESGRC